MTIKNILKHNRFVYSIYYYVFSFLLRTLGLFIKTDNDLILFTSYGGKKFDDSPRFVYEFIKRCPEYNKIKTIWAFSNPDDFPEVDNNVKIDSFAYFIVALRAKYWITNSSCARGLNFKKNDTINVLIFF